MLETVLAADVGGTNSRLTIYEVRKSSVNGNKIVPNASLFSKHYKNVDFPTFDKIIEDFLNDAGVRNPPKTACLAVAGPVNNNAVSLTNLGWIIDGTHLQDAFQIVKVRLVNDFVAAGYGLLTLDEEKECFLLQAGEKNDTAPKACIGAGTGLGECYLTAGEVDAQYTCYPSEGGHTEFSPRNNEQVKLLDELKRMFKEENRVSVERVVSGTGIVNVYMALTLAFPEHVLGQAYDKAVHDKIMAATKDKQAAIITSNLSAKLCRKTMDIFLSTYGTEAGAAALKWMPSGGLYLTGGLTPKFIDEIKDPNGLFMKALIDKGRLSFMVKKIPIYAVLVEDLGERGAYRQAYLDYIGYSKKSSGDSLSTSKGRSWSRVSSVLLAFALGTVVGASAATIW